ncbi:KN motif and ankyrin repeat domain-containing protein 1-like [Paramacrobiotus metropolitanus]|uniref:KN motif and ankyrin repeat domain-containing protein 1-like n=1 Tax=Paramacrobiotus metropolitanus TaxID=2943436 RepID=UPI0024463602|nr:KN motif and ankyrin repeat domain-containing protein 1-like [Paramacrobiotus metropolitanus]
MVPAEALESVREKLHAGLREMQRLQAQADLVPILQAEVEALKRKRAEMTVGTQTSEAIQRPALPEWLVSRRREEGELLDVLKQVAVREMSPLAVARVRAVLEGISRRDALEKATETEEVGSGQRRCSDIGVQSDDLLEDASLADSGNCESEEVEQLSIESPQLVDFGIGTDSPAMICIETWTPPAETNETATNTDPLPTPPPTLIRKAFRTPKKSPKQISHKKRRNSRQKKPVPTNAYENPLIIEEPEIPQETPAEPVDNVENGEKSADKPEVTESIAENGHREESAEKLTPSVEAVRPVSEDDPLSPAVSTHSEELSEDEGSYDLRHGYLSNKCGVEEKPSVTKIFTFDDYEAVGVISKEVMAACKVLNDYLQREGRSNSRSSESSVNGSLRKRTNKIDRCIRMIEEEWFRVAGQKNANAQLVNDYLDAFELMSKALLHKVVNLADNNGNTVLHYAISQNHFDVVSVLLDSKVCDVDSVNRAGYTATMLASLAHLATNTDQLVAARLFKLGDINRKAQQHGQTALMLAVSHGRLDTVRLLLQVGADVNIQDDDGSTALMCASEHGHLEIVRLLLGHPDTDAHLTDKDGMCALYVALEAQHKDIAALIYARTTLGPGDSLSHLRPPTVSASSSSSNEPHEVSRIPRSPTVPLKAPKRDTNGSGHGPESGRFGFTRKLNHTTSTM